MGGATVRSLGSAVRIVIFYNSLGRSTAWQLCLTHFCSKSMMRHRLNITERSIHSRPALLTSLYLGLIRTGGVRYLLASAHVPLNLNDHFNFRVPFPSPYPGLLIATTRMSFINRPGLWTVCLIKMEPRSKQACEPCRWDTMIINIGLNWVDSLCRKKKSKCTGERPTCSFCRRLNQLCTYRSPEPVRTAARKSNRVTKR